MVVLIIQNVTNSTNKCFVDTNILIYAHDLNARVKNEQAARLLGELWQEKNGFLSVQVLQEFASVLFSKFKKNAKQINDLLIPYTAAWPVISLKAPSIIKAITLKDRIKCSFWDSLILQAAMEAECNVLYSEDFSHKQKIGALQIINPFREN